MIGTTGTIDATGIIGQITGKAFRDSFLNVMKGVHSAELTIIPFAYGKPEKSGTVYRKFFYNPHGEVVKKISFDRDGYIEMKDTYEFNSKGKNLRGHFITDSSIYQEEYTYDDNGRLVKYLFTNVNWAQSKKEIYEFDKLGRKILKTSYGLMNTPEMITHYLYEDDSWKYRFRYVTRPNGDLITTFLFTNDKSGNLDALYSFSLVPEELKKLIKTKGWQLESDTRSFWTHDKKGNPITFMKDEKASKLNLLFANKEHGASEEGRIITQKSSSKYKMFNKRNYLIETIEWLPKFNEALKEVRKYEYYDVNNNVVDLT